MRIQWKKLIVFVAIPLVTGAVAAALNRDAISGYAMLKKPGFAPPGWLFPIVWTILYGMMGVASYQIAATGKNIRNALLIYALQLACNFVWPFLFFGASAYFPAFLWLVALWLLVLATIRSFLPISKSAGLLLIPYLLWVTFAGILNLAVALLN